MTLKYNLPCEIRVDDYHEFGNIQYYFDIVFSGIKVKEIGFSEDLCAYIGIVYEDNLKKPENRSLLNKLKRKCILE